MGGKVLLLITRYKDKLFGSLSFSLQPFYSTAHLLKPTPTTQKLIVTTVSIRVINHEERSCSFILNSYTFCCEFRTSYIHDVFRLTSALKYVRQTKL